MVWITIIQVAKEQKSYPMPAVPRVGDLIDLMPGVVTPGGNYVEVVRVIWRVPGLGLSDAELLKMEDTDLPDVWVYVQPVTSAARR